jgi:hypothetical protein
MEGSAPKDRDKRRGSGNAIRCFRIDFNLFRFGFFLKSETYSGNKFLNLSHTK